MMGVGYWENNCGYGVHVKWAVESDGDAGCRPRSDGFLPCSTYVAAHSKENAHTSDDSGLGRVLWIAYKAESSASGPFSVFHRVRADKTVDRITQAAKRSNLRSGPGTGHDKVGLLEIDDRVQVTGEIRNWLWIKTPNGGEAFVYAPLLAIPSSPVQNNAVQNSTQKLIFKRITYADGLRYEGQMREGKRHGRGASLGPMAIATRVTFLIIGATVGEIHIR